MRTILFILIITSLTTISEANVALHMNFYNSYDSMSMNLDGGNLGFGANSCLMSDSIDYDNGGSSNQPAAEYSYSLTLNGDTAFCGAKTDSGGFGWSGKVKASSSNKELKVVAVSAVKKGKLNDYYGNNKFEVREAVEANNSGYSQKALIKPDSVDGGGSGSTLEPVPGLAEAIKARTGNQSGNESNSQVSTNNLEVLGKESKDQGLIYSMNVQYGTGKHGSIDSSLVGRTEAQLQTQAKYVPGSYMFAVKERGIAFAPIRELVMKGKATDFPTQTLPPGNVEISYSDPITTKPKQNATSEPWDEYPGLVDSAYKDFDSAYPGTTITPALWYYLNNTYQINVDVTKIIPAVTYTPLTPVEQYDFGMSFDTSKK